MKNKEVKENKAVTKEPEENIEMELEDGEKVNKNFNELANDTANVIKDSFEDYRDFIAGMLQIYRPKFGDPVILNHLENVCLMIRLHQTGLIKTEEETKEQ